MCREIALVLLTRQDIERYLALEFPRHRFPEGLPALIHAKTEGNPLFMVDLLRHLRDRQVFAQEQGRWGLARSLPDLERDLPESVRSMIERKIAQLGEEDRRLLVAASVQGFEFEAAVVARALALDAAEVEEQLERLERVYAFVRLVGEHEFPDRTLTLRYRFVHVLYQNALYGSLRPTRRASLCAAVAQALVAYHGEKSAAVAGELASLWEAHGSSRGPPTVTSRRRRMPPASSPTGRRSYSRAGGWICCRRCRIVLSVRGRSWPCKSPWARP